MTKNIDPIVDVKTNVFAKSDWCDIELPAAVLEGAAKVVFWSGENKNFEWMAIFVAGIFVTHREP